jgi:hypothetical protein
MSALSRSQRNEASLGRVPTTAGRSVLYNGCVREWRTYVGLWHKTSLCAAGDMSEAGGRPEVAGTRSNRRDWLGPAFLLPHGAPAALSLLPSWQVAHSCRRKHPQKILSLRNLDTVLNTRFVTGVLCLGTPTYTDLHRVHLI